MQTGIVVIGSPTLLSIWRACSIPCSAARRKKNAAVAFSRATPRPLAYIQPRSNRAAATRRALVHPSSAGSA